MQTQLAHAHFACCSGKYDRVDDAEKRLAGVGVYARNPAQRSVAGVVVHGHVSLVGSTAAQDDAQRSPLFHARFVFVFG